MRLTCPNCGAQYEVPDEVIPSEGRDVQCSNCGHTWFQAHPESAAEAEQSALRAARDGADREAPEPGWNVEPEPEPEPVIEPDYGPVPDYAPEPDFEPEFEPEQEPAPTPEPATEEQPPEPGPARQGLDSAVSDILRQEAEREAQLRAAEAGGLESQPELGLESPADDSARRAREARERMARIRGEEEETEAPEAQAASRRELLPDIEEINSTLRSSSGMAAGADQGELPVGAPISQRRSGFLRGVSVALLIGAFLLLVYANAPRIAQTLPQADPALSAYVAMVDQARYWLDAQLGEFVTRVLPE